MGGVFEVFGQSHAEEGEDGLTARDLRRVVLGVWSRFGGIVAETGRLVPSDPEHVAQVHRARSRRRRGSGGGGERKEEEEEEESHGWD